MTTTERAEQLTAKFLAAQADYLAECREYAEQGYRHPECFHGTSQWTDYDNICAGCEDDETINQWSSREEVEAYARGIADAEAREREAEARRQAEHERQIVANGTGQTCELLQTGGWAPFPFVRFVGFDTKNSILTIEIVTDGRIKQIDVGRSLFRLTPA